MVAQLNRIKGFKPDQIVFETEKIQQDKLQNSNYQSEGSQELEANEEENKLQLYTISNE